MATDAPSPTPVNPYFFRVVSMLLGYHNTMLRALAYRGSSLASSWPAKSVKVPHWWPGVIGRSVAFRRDRFEAFSQADWFANAARMRYRYIQNCRPPGFDLLPKFKTHCELHICPFCYARKVAASFTRIQDAYFLEKRWVDAKGKAHKSYRKEGNFSAVFFENDIDYDAYEANLYDEPLPRIVDRLIARSRVELDCDRRYWTDKGSGISSLHIFPGREGEHGLLNYKTYNRSVLLFDHPNKNIVVPLIQHVTAPPVELVRPTRHLFATHFAKTFAFPWDLFMRAEPEQLAQVLNCTAGYVDGIGRAQMYRPLGWLRKKGGHKNAD